MSIESDIVSLLNLAGVTGYADILPERVTFPCAVYEIVSADFGEAFDGADGHEVYYVIVTVYARTKSACASKAAAIKDTLHGVTRAQLAAWLAAESIAGTYSGIFGDFGGSAYEYENKTFSQQVSLEIHKQN
jgi:hypothetical protein